MKKIIIAGITGLVIGALVVGSLVALLDHRKMTTRAACARALFRVAERHIGHDLLVAEWREEWHSTPEWQALHKKWKEVRP